MEQVWLPLVVNIGQIFGLQSYRGLQKMTQQHHKALPVLLHPNTAFNKGVANSLIVLLYI